MSYLTWLFPESYTLQTLLSSPIYEVKRVFPSFKNRKIKSWFASSQRRVSISSKRDVKKELFPPACLSTMWIFSCTPCVCSHWIIQRRGRYSMTSGSLSSGETAFNVSTWKGKSVNYSWNLSRCCNIFVNRTTIITGSSFNSKTWIPNVRVNRWNLSDCGPNLSF